jgi:hypothetical protein
MDGLAEEEIVTTARFTIDCKTTNETLGASFESPE